jgi:hypothetical protein
LFHGLFLLEKVIIVFIYMLNKKLLYALFGIIISIPFFSLAVSISVPQATSFGQTLRGNANGTYTPVATSTLGFASYPFTPTSNYGATQQATSGVLWLQNGVYASSTSHFVNSSSTLATIVTGWFTDIFVGADTLLEYIADGAGAMFTGNTETGITVTYQDADNTVDVVCDTASGSVFGCLASADWTTFNNKQATISATYPLVLTGATLSTPLASTTIKQTYGTNQIGELSFATSSDTNLGLNITNTNGAFTFTPAWIGTLANSRLTNSSVSYGGVSVSLGASDATPAFDLTDATLLPISTGVSGLGTGVATFLATPSSANFASAVTGETGSGAVTFATSPTFTTDITTPIVTGTSYSATSTLPNASTTNMRVNGILDLWGTAQSTFSAFVDNIITSLITKLANKVWDFGDSTSVEIPNGATPTVDAIGEIAFKTSPANALIIATSTNASYPMIYPAPYIAFQTATTSATTTAEYATLDYSERMVSGICYVSSGTAGGIRVGDGTNWSNYSALTSATSTVTFTSNNRFEANGEKIIFQIGATGYAQVSCKFRRQYEI